MNALSPPAMTGSPSGPVSGLIGAACRRVWRRARKIGPLGSIIALHVAFFLALQSGLIRQVATATPKEVIVALITQQRAPEPVALAKAPPKVVPVVKKPVTPPSPIPIPMQITPAPMAISVPPQPAEPSPPAAVPTLSTAPVPTSAPASPPGPPMPKQITGIEYITPPQPDYPATSKRMGEEGVVQFRVLVNTEGRAEKVDIIKGAGSSRLDNAARRAVMRAVFKPYIEDGRPLVVSAIGSIAFRLDQ